MKKNTKQYQLYYSFEVYIKLYYKNKDNHKWSSKPECDNRNNNKLSNPY